MVDPATLTVSVQESDFDAAQLQRALLSGTNTEGAVATFTGYVRKHNLEQAVNTLTLEHYPGMTERALTDILEQARARWPLQGGRIIHRYGPLEPGDRIVLVLTASRHREAAFEAAAFLMDYLKTKAPFWKKEAGAHGAEWVDAREADDMATARWDS